MSDVILYLSVAGALTVILCIISLIFRRRTAGNDDKVSDELRRDEDASVINRQAAPRRVAGARQVRSRFEAQRARQEQRRTTQADPDFDRQSGSDDEEDDGGGADDIVFPGGKIGVKKRRKLEMKAEKRAQREAELQDREEKKTRQAAQDEERRRHEELQKQEELKREEEAKKIKEEKAKREHEAYLQLKQSFQVESEGFEEKDNEDQENDLLTKFVDYIKTEKVVVLEDLAVRFNLKTQDAIDRLQNLLQDGRLIGVIDDRGKFIYITAEELESIARFIRQRGRVSIADIAESSNTLISLASKQPLESNV